MQAGLIASDIDATGPFVMVGFYPDSVLLTGLPATWPPSSGQKVYRLVPGMTQSQLQSAVTADLTAIVAQKGPANTMQPLVGTVIKVAG